MMHILFVDDHVLVRNGIAGMLEANLEAKVHEVSSPEDGLDIIAATEHSFDLVLLDLEFPGRTGPHPVELYRARHPKLPILVLSSHSNHKTILASATLGATGFVAKSAALSHLLSAIQMTVAGMPFIPIGQAPAYRIDPRRRLPGEADPEAELMALLVEGLSDKQLADCMGLAISTVRHRLTALYRRLGCRNRVEAVARIIQQGSVLTER